MKRKYIFGLLLGLPMLLSCHREVVHPDPVTIFGFWRYQTGVIVESDELEPGIIPLAYAILKEDGTMSGMTSRNILGGTYRYDETGIIKLDFNPLTRVYDTPWSAEFQQMLGAVNRYRLEDERLFLINTETEEELEFLRLSSNLCKPIPNNRQLYDQIESDFFTIEDVVIAGNCLEVTIEYSGGCGEADAMLIGSGDYMESLPVQLNVRLLLKDEDPCEALVRKSFYFNLNTVLPHGEETIILHLEGWPMDIYYTRN